MDIALLVAWLNDITVFFHFIAIDHHHRDDSRKNFKSLNWCIVYAHKHQKRLFVNWIEYEEIRLCVPCHRRWKLWCFQCLYLVCIYIPIFANDPKCNSSEFILRPNNDFFSLLLRLIFELLFNVVVSSPASSVYLRRTKSNWKEWKNGISGTVRIH